MQRLETSVSAMFNVLIPPLTLLLAHWMLGEPLHVQVIGGLLLVVLGLVLVVWRRHHDSHERRVPQPLPQMRPQVSRAQQS